MNNKIKLSILVSTLLLTSCVGPQASFSERFQDGFLFTSAESVTESKCLIVTKPYTLHSGSVSFYIPGGKYFARKRNNTGYFYYAPGSIKSSNSFLAFDQDGLYINNQFTSGNIFGKAPRGYADRPIRGAVLPGNFFDYLKQSAC